MSEAGTLAALAPQNTSRISLDHCPHNPPGDSNGLLPLIKRGVKLEQPRLRASPLPLMHVSSPFQPWFVKPKQARGQQSCRGFESPYK